jgi:hypothetical protein
MPSFKVPFASLALLGLASFSNAVATPVDGELSRTPAIKWFHFINHNVYLHSLARLPPRRGH